MRAAVLHDFGDPDAFSIESVPTPRPGPNEVLVKVAAAGVGSWDPPLRSGEWSQGDEKFPLILGSDGAGTVVGKGARVNRFRLGERVYGYNFGNAKGGFYAQYVAVPVSNVMRFPAGFDAIHAGALAAIGLTALEGVDDALGLAPDETVIITGASGNVGILAVQFAKLRGARVLAVASGGDGVALVSRLGADAAIDGRRENVAADAKRFAPDGADAVLAFAGGTVLTKCLDNLRRGGRLAYPNGIEPEPRKRRGLKVKTYDAEPGVRQFERLNEAMEKGDVELPIAKTYALADVAKAHELIEKGHVVGRVVLKI
ncbi:MAG TPA: NADP-dependent oxidoreductase [Gemmatimonadaceae bacterium]|nr:NADP-dependent oxidoreductase [Gemmatimonadaceae bacterium]